VITDKCPICNGVTNVVIIALNENRYALCQKCSKAFRKTKDSDKWEEIDIYELLIL